MSVDKYNKSVFPLCIFLYNYVDNDVKRFMPCYINIIISIIAFLYVGNQFIFTTAEFIGT